MVLSKIVNLIRNCIFLCCWLLTIGTTNAQLLINEVLAKNATTVADPDFGEFADAFELINAGQNSVNLNGYTLTDDKGNPSKWKLPNRVLNPAEIVIIWADGKSKCPGDTAYVNYNNKVISIKSLHANFKLNGDGEYLAIYNAQGNLIDAYTYCVQENDISVGRNPVQKTDWWYYNNPTIGTPNHLYGSAHLESPDSPTFSHTEGFYAQPILVELNASDPIAIIRYTLDGSNPTYNSLEYTSPIPIQTNSTLKARTFVEGKMSSQTTTKTFFIRETYPVPVMSISTADEHLYDFELGILQNAIKDREIPATLEYFEAGTGNKAFHANIGIRVFGTTIFNLPQRPLSVRFRSKYGTEFLDYPLFKDKPITKFSSFLLRNGGNDHNLAYFRDGLASQLIPEYMDLDHQAYQPCLVFINGVYHGIYEIRERLDEQYLANNHEINPGNLDYLEDSLNIVAGDIYQFQELIQFVRQNDLKDSANYAKITREIDINAFINFQFIRAFIGYQIADLNNRYWHNKDTDSPWRWIASDLEHGFGQLGGDQVDANTLEKLAGVNTHLPEWSTLLFKKLLEQPLFRDEFIQRAAFLLQTYFHPDSTIQILNKLESQFQPLMPRHINRWGTPLSFAQWKAQVQVIREFLKNRPKHFSNHLSALLGVQEQSKVLMKVEGQGRLEVCQLPFPSNTQATFFHKARIPIKAVPAPGHRFVQWKGLLTSTATTSLIPAQDTALTAVFEAIPNYSVIPSLIDKDTLLTTARSPWYASEDVAIAPGAQLKVEPGATLILADGVCFNVYGGLRLIGSAQQRITIKSHPESINSKANKGLAGHWGAIGIWNATDSVIFSHTDILGGSYGRNRKTCPAAVYSVTSNVSFNHCNIADGKAPFIARGGSVYAGHSTFHTFSSVNGFISLYNLQNPVIEHCIFIGNRAENTDAIDLKGITGGRVHYNYIEGFTGGNCDGIDLGIYSKNVLVESNLIHHCSDKGISIGSQSSAIVRNNIITHCDLGVALKDSLTLAYVDKNTFYGNRIGVACYEKSILRGGAKAYVRNTLFSNQLDASIQADSKSTIEANYSLSDTDEIPGTGNLFSAAGLVHPSTGNFGLLPGSACIDAGDPFSPLDPDGSRTDIGAIYSHPGNFGLSVHFNEINYHSAPNYNAGDWVELYNASVDPVDLKNWKLSQGSSVHVFQQSIPIAPGQYLVLAEDTLLFKARYPDFKGSLLHLRMPLNNNSGTLLLHHSNGNLVHSLRYSDKLPWPTLPNGHGATLELEPGTQGNQIADWRESYTLLGTPGQSNSLPHNTTTLFVNEILASNKLTIADELGEYDDYLELYNASSESVQLGGWCFSDDASIPCKSQLPLNHPDKTLIQPGGFLLLWADDQPEQGPLHLNFKLSANGERVAMSQRMGNTWMERDGLAFGQQQTDRSFGRIPDGSPFVAFMPPSPGSTNNTSRTGDRVQESIKAFPNPCAAMFYLDASQVKGPYHIQCFNSLGKAVYQASNVVNTGINIQCEAWSPGVYSLRIVDSLNNAAVLKIIKN